MPPRPPQAARPLALIWGDDDFGVKRRARQLYQQWCQEVGGMDHESIDASVANSGEALKAVGRLRDALQTLPFFGTAKVIWFQNCNFLGEERMASTAQVTETLTELAQEWKTFDWKGVRLLISAGKVDKRRTFYKTIENLGQVENFAELSLEDRDWAARAESWVQNELRSRNKEISDEALAELVTSVGPHLRLLNNELEKVMLYVGDQPVIEAGDVKAIVTREKQARAFALGDAVGDRDLPRALRALDDSLWELKFDGQKSAIGLLYGLISKVRVLIFLKEALRAGWLKPDADWNRFKTQLEQVPANLLPEDKRLNPLAMHPYVLFKALPQTRRYSIAELIHAMELLLECNQRLIFSTLDESLVLQQTLVKILSPEATLASA
jgi:DNA polymerase-3 subunit delta